MEEPRQPVGPEIDDSSNPTAASPDAEAAAPAGEPVTGGRRVTGGREMVAQLQAMIDSLAVQATPVMREVAAKAAELAAVAGEKAGPLAHRAAAATEKAGVRVAARSKEMAADLRRPQAAEPVSTNGPATPAADDEEGG